MEYPEWIKRYRAGEPFTVDDIADAIESLLDEIDRTIETLDTKGDTNMGAFDKAKPVIIPDPEDAKASEAFRKKWGWEAHEQIIIRGQFTAADQEAMENASSALEGKGKHRTVKMRTGTARRTLLERMIVDWTLTEAGRPVEVNAANIGRLPSNYRKPVLEACDEIARVMDEDEQDDFLDGANAPTTDS